jgi:hypothetical protein
VSQAILLGRWWNTDRGEIWLARAYDHVELPRIKPVTTRINLHRADCRCCDNTITAEKLIRGCSETKKRKAGL